MRNNKIVFYLFLGFLLFLSLQLNLLGKFVPCPDGTSVEERPSSNDEGAGSLRTLKSFLTTRYFEFYCTSA